MSAPETGRRPARARLLWALLFACLLAIAIAMPGVAFSAAEEPAPAGTGSELPLPDEGEISSALSHAFDAHQQEVDRRESELAEPAAVAERELSRDAYADLGPMEAESLLRSSFGSVLDGLEQDPARFLSDAHVDQVLEEGAAMVTSEGNTQLLETSIPVEAEEEDGDLGKVDLTLEQTPTGWEPENPVVDVEIGKSTAEGVGFGDEGLAITQVGAEDGSGRLLGDKNVFFSEVAAGTDTDVLVSPVANGVEIFDLLRSIDSPESLRFHLDLPSGAQLREGAAGSAEVVGADGEVVAVVPHPWARDAQGTSVPVELSVEGDFLVLGVEHRDQDLAYPLLVDPTIYQNWTSWYQGQHLSGLGAWRWQQSEAAWWVGHGTEDKSGFPGYEGKGLFVTSAPGHLVGHQWGQWIYSAPNGGSYLSSVSISPFWRNDRTCSKDYYPYDYAGMWIESSGWHQLDFNDAKEHESSSLSQWGEAVIVGLSTDEGTDVQMACSRDLMIGGVGISLDDWQIPWMTIITALPTTWLKKDATARPVEVKGTDMGLGVQRFRMYSAAKEWGWDQPFCAGTYEDRCATERTGKITYTTESAGGEGKVPVSLQVIDPTDKRGTVERTLMIDGTAPTVSPSGEQTPSAYKLTVEAKDGSPAAPRSGVKETKVYLDGTLKETRTNTCSSSGCPEALSFTYTQNLSGLALGKHIL